MRLNWHDSAANPIWKKVFEPKTAGKKAAIDECPDDTNPVNSCQGCMIDVSMFGEPQVYLKGGCWREEILQSKISALVMMIPKVSSSLMEPRFPQSLKAKIGQFIDSPGFSKQVSSFSFIEPKRFTNIEYIDWS